MKARWLLTLLLALVTIALALVAYMMPRSAEHGGFTLSALAPKQVERIRVERAGETPIVLERTGDGWRITEPVRAAADPAEVNRLLAVLGAQAPQRMAPVELARFELDRPQLRLSFNGEALDFGMVSAVAREQYVLAGSAVYVIEPKYTVHIPRTAVGFVQRRLLAGTVGITRLELPGFAVTQEAGGWTFSPQAPEMTPEGLSQFVDVWRNAVAQRVERAGTDVPQGEVNVQLGDGKAVRLGIVARGKETAMRDTTSGLDFIFSAAAAARLLSRPGAVTQHQDTVK